MYYYPKSDELINLPDSDFSDILSEHVTCSVLNA